MKAKLFLSCGQNRSFREVEYAEQIRDALEALGFDVFFAPQIQDNKAVIDIIFRELNDSDYFVFIDFKRERLLRGKKGNEYPVNRGSLFSHQEFAIACYLKIPLMAFQEKGVERLSGVVAFVMANARAFNRRSDLARLVKAEVEERLLNNEWSLKTRNCLALSARPHDGSIQSWANNVKVSHHHITVTNLHLRKAATGCYAYIETMRDLKTDHVIPLYTCELKWEGTAIQGVRISPNSSRGVDAFIVIQEPQKSLLFKPSTDAQNHMINFDHPVKLEVSYVVCSNEFPDGRKKFEIDYDGHGRILKWQEMAAV